MERWNGGTLTWLPAAANPTGVFTFVKDAGREGSVKRPEDARLASTYQSAGFALIQPKAARRGFRSFLAEAVS